MNWFEKLMLVLTFIGAVATAMLAGMKAWPKPPVPVVSTLSDDWKCAWLAGRQVCVLDQALDGGVR